MSVGGERLSTHRELPTVDDEALQRGRQWVDGLRTASETEGVLVGEPEEELQSALYPIDVGDVVMLIPGYQFWRISEDINGTSSSAPYFTGSPMQVSSYRFRKDNEGETWVHLRSPAGDDLTFEKARIRLSRLEQGEHDIAATGGGSLEERE